jgi:hypothetical protein
MLLLLSSSFCAADVDVAVVLGDDDIVDDNGEDEGEGDDGDDDVLEVNSNGLSGGVTGAGVGVAEEVTEVEI